MTVRNVERFAGHFFGYLGCSPPKNDGYLPMTDLRNGPECQSISRVLCFYCDACWRTLNADSTYVVTVSVPRALSGQVPSESHGHSPLPIDSMATMHRDADHEATANSAQKVIRCPLVFVKELKKNDPIGRCDIFGTKRKRLVPDRIQRLRLCRCLVRFLSDMDDAERVTFSIRIHGHQISGMRDLE